MKFTSLILTALLVICVMVFVFAGCRKPAQTISTEIIFFVEAGDIKKVSELLKAEPDLINAKNKEGVPLLMVGIMTRRKEMVAALLDMGADVRTTQPRGETCLHVVADKEIAELLIKRGANVNAKDKDGTTVLRWAAYNNFSGVAEALLANRADVESKNDEGQTALHIAASHGHKEVVIVLLEYKAEVNIKDRHGNTPLKYALTKGNKVIADLLRQHGAKD